MMCSTNRKLLLLEYSDYNAKIKQPLISMVADSPCKKEKLDMAIA